MHLDGNHTKMFDGSITSLRRHGAFQTTDLAIKLAVTMVAEL